MTEINCYICGETYLTNEAITTEDVVFRCTIYVCPKCREELLRSKLLIEKENEKC